MSKSVFETLSTINVNDKVEKKNGLTYLSWAWAWAEVKRHYPNSTYTIYENAEGLNFHHDGKTAWVKTGVTIEDIEHIEYGDVTSISNGIANIFSCPYAVYGGVLRATGDQAAALAAAQASPPENCLGGSNGAGFGWEDMTVVKVGFQWQTGTKNTWRIGYSTGDQPIPDDETLFNIIAPGVVEEHFTAGFTRQLDKKSSINFSAMYAPNESVKGGSPFDPAQEIEIEMDQYELALTYSRNVF